MTSFASVVLVDRRGWILLQERDEFPVIDPEKWGLVGGHLEPGEDPRPGAVRELAEETGVVLEPGRPDACGATSRCSTRPTARWDTMWVFAARCDLTDDDIVLGEGRRIVFVDPADARALDLTAGAGWPSRPSSTPTLYASMAP